MYNSHLSPPSPPLSPSLPSPSPFPLPLPSPSLPLVTQQIHCPFQPKQSPSLLVIYETIPYFPSDRLFSLFLWQIFVNIWLAVVNHKLYNNIMNELYCLNQAVIVQLLSHVSLEWDK